MQFIPNELMNLVFLGKSVSQIVFMLPDALD